MKISILSHNEKTLERFCMGAMLFDFCFEDWINDEEVETTNIVKFLKILGQVE